MWKNLKSWSGMVSRIGDVMKAILTSSLGGFSKINGIRMPEPISQNNGLLDRIKEILTYAITEIRKSLIIWKKLMC